MVFGSLVLTTGSGLFSIACHLIWSNTSSSVGSVPFFRILRIAWIGLLMMNSVLFHVGKHCFIFGICIFTSGWFIWNALLCSYFTNLWPVHLNNHEMIHQLVSFTFHNFHTLLSPLSHGSLHALAANSNGRPAFKRGKTVPAFVISSLCYFHLIMGL